ncbi:MAG: glycosyltransferase [Candidatus Zixiibacteriota bacterium]
MKLAVQNPHWIYLTDSRQTHDYGVEFLRLYKPLLFLSRAEDRPLLSRFLEAKHLSADDFEVTHSVSVLNREADVLLCFNGFPHIPPHEPVRRFAGLKIYHIMDGMRDCVQVHEALVEGRVDFLMACAAHDRYDPAFRAAFPEFTGRVIGVPVGFHPRHSDIVPFAVRKNKCVAIGTDDPTSDQNQWQRAHSLSTDGPAAETRRSDFSQRLAAPTAELRNWLDVPLQGSLPTDAGGGRDELANGYRLFAPLESGLHYPPPVAFSGTATGGVMICPDHPCYRDLGFFGGVHCITYRESDLADFLGKLASYLADPDTLYPIHAEGMRFVRERFNHRAVAQALYADIQALWIGHRVSGAELEAASPMHPSLAATAGR